MENAFSTGNNGQRIVASEAAPAFPPDGPERDFELESRRNRKLRLTKSKSRDSDRFSQNESRDLDCYGYSFSTHPHLRKEAGQ